MPNLKNRRRPTTTQKKSKRPSPPVDVGRDADVPPYEDRAVRTADLHRESTARKKQ